MVVTSCIYIGNILIIQMQLLSLRMMFNGKPRLYKCVFFSEQRRFSSTKENGPEENKKTFQNLQGEFHVNKTCGSSGLDLVSSCNHNQQPDCRNVIKRADNLMTYNSQDMPTTCHTFNCIDEALQWLNNSEESERKSHVEVNNLPPFLSYADEIEVLVTGSMYLVGGVLSLIKPNIND